MVISNFTLSPRLPSPPCQIPLLNKSITIMLVTPFQSSLRTKSMFSKLQKGFSEDSALFPDTCLFLYHLHSSHTDCICGSLNTSHFHMSTLFQTCLLCYIFLFLALFFPYSFLNSLAILSFKTLNPFANCLGSPWRKTAENAWPSSCDSANLLALLQLLLTVSCNIILKSSEQRLFLCSSYLLSKYSPATLGARHALAHHVLPMKAQYAVLSFLLVSKLMEIRTSLFKSFYCHTLTF